MARKKTTLNVEGMSCEHCVRAVKAALGALDGVESVEVNLEGKKVTVDYESDKITPDLLKNTIENQGYEVV